MAVWTFTIWASPINENKLTWTISCNHKTLINCHHDAPKSRNPGFNFVLFLVNGLSTRNHGESTKCTCQKQPFRGFVLKRCSENMEQIYRRTPMPKCDFNKVAKQLCWNHTSACVFSCKFAAYFQNTFSQEHLWMAASA